MILYSEELKEYLKHFPVLFAWKVENEKVTEHSNQILYFQVEPLIDKAAIPASNNVYEFHTGLKEIQYLKNNEIYNGMAIAIDVDTKGREEQATIENLKRGKEISNQIIKKFAKLGLKSLFKFSGFGYHILLFFSNTIFDSVFSEKDIATIIKKIILDTDLDKTTVKEIEIKTDKVRSLFSYNSKYGNYSITTDITKSAELDLENSKKYIEQKVDFDELINEKIPTGEMAFYIDKELERKEKQKKFIKTIDEIAELFKTEKINPKSIIIEGNQFKDKTLQNKLILDAIKTTSIKNTNAAKASILFYVKSEKNMTFYDKIIENGAKDGRKRLLFLIVGPYFGIKDNYDKTKMFDDINNWLIKSGVPENKLIDYRNEVNSIITSMKVGIRPTSIDSLLLRFGVSTKEEFADIYIKK